MSVLLGTQPPPILRTSESKGRPCSTGEYPDLGCPSPPCFPPPGLEHGGQRPFDRLGDSSGHFRGCPRLDGCTFFRVPWVFLGSQNANRPKKTARPSFGCPFQLQGRGPFADIHGTEHGQAPPPKQTLRPSGPRKVWDWLASLNLSQERSWRCSVAHFVG